MKTVHKYTFEAARKQSIEMPVGAKVLTSIVQREDIVVYAEVDLPTSGQIETEDKHFFIFGTGDLVNPEEIEGYTYLATIPYMNAQVIFHVYYK